MILGEKVWTPIFWASSLPQWHILGFLFPQINYFNFSILLFHHMVLLQNGLEQSWFSFERKSHGVKGQESESLLSIFKIPMVYQIGLGWTTTYIGTSPFLSKAS
jgi:hypothetical protein